jgi:hypothetical protein
MDIDDTIMRLRDAPVHARLAALDGAMLAKLANERADDLRRPVVFASLLALIAGVIGAGLPTEPAVARNTLTPFGAASPLTPSALLGDTG